MINSANFRIPIVVWLLSCITFSGFSQTVQTNLGDSVIKACPNSSIVIPVIVKNMTSVDSLLLTLKYNISSLSYDSLNWKNNALAGGTLQIKDVSGVLTIHFLKGSNPVNINNDILVKLVFQTHSGNSTLAWDTTQPYRSYYMSQGNLLPDEFTNSDVKQFPVLNLNMVQVGLPKCFNSCNSGYTASVSGGKMPYWYFWNHVPVPDTISVLYDSTKNNLCVGKNYVQILDDNGCTVDQNFTIDGIPASKVEITVKPGDTVYMQNPVIYCSFENKSNGTIKEWLWHFGDGDSSAVLDPGHIYSGIESFKGDNYELSLWVKNGFGCDTLYTLTLPIRQSKLFIPNVFSPNSGSERNKTFKIVKDGSHEDLTSEYMSLELQVFNRYGKRVYKNDNYRSDWDGSNLSDGVYYYVLNARGLFRTDKYKGSVTILGGGR
jgi:hypothetical protein